MVAITLAWVVLQVVLVDALGLASFLPLVLALAFAFGISRRLQLLEEHTFIDLPGPEKLVFLDGLHCRLQSGSICHELVNLPPGISLRPQECKVVVSALLWRAHRTNHTIHPSLTRESQCAHQEVVPKDHMHALQLAPGLRIGSFFFLLLFFKAIHCELTVTLGWPLPLLREG